MLSEERGSFLSHLRRLSSFAVKSACTGPLAPCVADWCERGGRVCGNLFHKIEMGHGFNGFARIKKTFFY